MYIQNLIPKLHKLQPLLLINEAIAADWATQYPDFDLLPVSSHLNPDRGSISYLYRFGWTQFQLPRHCAKARGRVLFSPIPELPLSRSIGGVVTLHDCIPLHFPQARSPLYYYYRHYVPRVLHKAQQIICVSQATAQDAIDFYQVPAHQLTVVPQGYDRENFRPLDLPKKNYVLYIGRPNPYKNLHRALVAFSQVPGHQAYEFWIAGPADRRYLPELEGLAWELGVQLRVLNYVAYSELPVLINQAIALIFPSQWEGFGLPVLEAMACGTPVITSNLASMPEVAGDAALLVDPYSTADITQAMTAILKDDRLQQELRDRSLKQAQLFSWERTAAETEAVLSSVLNR